MLSYAGREAAIVGIDPRAYPEGGHDPEDLTESAVDQKMAWWVRPSVTFGAATTNMVAPATLLNAVSTSPVVFRSRWEDAGSNSAAGRLLTALSALVGWLTPVAWTGSLPNPDAEGRLDAAAVLLFCVVELGGRVGTSGDRAPRG